MWPPAMTNVKGRSLVTNSAVAEDAAIDRTTRRALFGAGAIGAVLALASSRPASAVPGLSDEDVALVGFAIGLELTARDLYDSAIDAGADGSIWTVMREQHEGAAQLLSGLSGVSANARNDAAFDALEGGFRTTTRAAAFELENIAAATHIELLASVAENEAAAAIASIAAIESRHATVLASIAEQDDLDSLFSNSAQALSPEA